MIVAPLFPVLLMATPVGLVRFVRPGTARLGIARELRTAACPLL